MLYFQNTHNFCGSNQDIRKNCSPAVKGIVETVVQYSLETTVEDADHDVNE